MIQHCLYRWKAAKNFYLGSLNVTEWHKQRNLKTVKFIQWNQSFSICGQKMKQWSIKLWRRKWIYLYYRGIKNSTCNFNDAYILVWGDITFLGRHAATQVTFKSCTTFIKLIAKTDGTTIGDAEDLDLVMEFELF